MPLFSEIISRIEDPQGLELLYRKNPKAFKKVYREVLEENPESILLKAWEARLEYKETGNALTTADLIVMVVLCILAGSLLKLPEWTAIDESFFYPRFILMIPFSVMFMFTMHMRKWPQRITIAGFCALGAIAIGISAVPERWDDVFALACLNLPFLLWTLYGASRLEGNWNSTEGRIEFLRFSGELIIHAGLFFLGGGILLLLTFGLFELLDIRTMWIMEYPAVYGYAAIPLVAAWATDSYSAARKLVPLLARIFSPLLLTLILTYMGAMAFNIDELFQDRSTLLIYNILLLCVLATAVFTLTGRNEREPGRLQTSVISLMVAATLALDIIAVSAIGWRIYEYGLTVNRLAVLGSNIVVFGNLLLMGIGYIRYWRGNGTLSDIETAIAKYLPVYTGWTFFAVFIQPWLFRY